MRRSRDRKNGLPYGGYTKSESVNTVSAERDEAPGERRRSPMYRVTSSLVPARA